MRGGRLIALLLVVLAPLALADSIQHPDPVGDERTISNLQLYNDQPQPVVCHDASIDIAGIRIERGTTVRATYTFAGPVAAPLLRCNDTPIAATDRTWDLHLGGSAMFTAKATSGAGAPSVACVKANHPAHGNSGCVTAVNIVSDGFWFEIPREATLVYEDGWTNTYSLTGTLNAHPLSYSRVTAGASPMQRVVYGASDWTDATLG